MANGVLAWQKTADLPRYKCRLCADVFLNWVTLGKARAHEDAPTLALHELSLILPPAHASLHVDAVPPVPAPSPIGEPSTMNGVAMLPAPAGPGLMAMAEASELIDHDEDMHDAHE